MRWTAMMILIILIILKIMTINDNDDNNTGNPIDALERDIVKEIKKDKQFCHFLIDRNWTLFCDTCQSIFLHFFSMRSHLVQGRKKWTLTNSTFALVISNVMFIFGTEKIFWLWKWFLFSSFKFCVLFFSWWDRTSL